MEELTQEELLALELAAEEEQATLDLAKQTELLQSDEVYQSTVNRIQNDSQLSNSQKQLQIQVITEAATDKLKKKQANPVKDYDYFYGDLKSDDGTPIKPAENLGVFNTIKATAGDIGQFVGFSTDDNEAQIKRAELEAQDAEFNAAAEAEKAKYPTFDVPWWAQSKVNADGEPISVYYSVGPDNEVKMTNKRCPKGSAKSVLLFVK